MSTPRNRRTITLGVAVVSLAAAGGALAAAKIGASHKGSGGGVAAGSPVSSAASSSATRGWHAFGHHDGMPGGRHDGLAAAATYLGISESDLIAKLQSGKTLAQIADATSGKSASGLIDALVAAEQKEIAADVSSGRLTQAQADQILSDLKQRITDRVNATGPPRDHRGGRGPGGDLAVAASYLGISESDLIADLRAGKTLGQVADATSGKSRSGLIAKLVAEEKTELAQAVTDGHLTQAQANELAATLQDRVTRLVDGTFPARPDGMGHAPPFGDGATPPTHI